MTPTRCARGHGDQPEATTAHATQRNGWAWCALAAVLFGAATPATKLVVDNAGSVALAGLLYVGAAGAVAPFALREQRSTATSRQRARLFLAAGFGGGLASVLLILALDRIPAGTVSLFLDLELLAAVVIARMFLQEHIGRRAGLGSVVVVLGGVVLGGVILRRHLVFSCRHRRAPCRRDMCVLGIDNAITANLDSYTPSQITLVKGLVAGTVNLLFGSRSTARRQSDTCSPHLRSVQSATGSRSRRGSPAPD